MIKKISKSINSKEKEEKEKIKLTIVDLVKPFFGCYSKESPTDEDKKNFNDKLSHFIKQELNASHFISVSKNGIMVMLYMTLIASMLLQLYKKLNGLGYKTAKRRFTIELWETLVTIIVKECGGNPELINKGYLNQFSVP